MGIKEVRGDFEGHSIVLQRQFSLFDDKGIDIKLYIDGEVVDSMSNFWFFTGEHPLLRGKITHNGKLHIVETKVKTTILGKTTYYIYVDGNEIAKGKYWS